MSEDVLYLVASAIVTWLSVLSAALIRARAWTMKGTLLALGNREAMPEHTAFSGRAERAARNMLENFVLFLAILAAAHFSNRTGPTVDLGAAVFFWSRLAYWLCYLAGIIYLRTLLWVGGIIGIALILFALF